jgi:hypothetical protein
MYMVIIHRYEVTPYNQYEAVEIPWFGVFPFIYRNTLLPPVDHPKYWTELMLNWSEDNLWSLGGEVGAILLHSMLESFVSWILTNIGGLPVRMENNKYSKFWYLHKYRIKFFILKGWYKTYFFNEKIITSVQAKWAGDILPVGISFVSRVQRAHFV